MECTIFGSTQSLEGLLNEHMFNSCGGDQVLQDWTLLCGEGTGLASQATSLTDAGSMDGTLSEFGSDVIPAGHSASLPSTISTVGPCSQGLQWQAQSAPLRSMMSNPSPASSSATTQQCVPDILPKPASVTRSQPLHPRLPSQSTSGAMMPNIEHYGTPEPEATPAAPGTSTLTVDDLTEQQQQTLKTIMQLCAKSDNKKARRMLSNRESARRSRCRKQAHVQELEAKLKDFSEENESLKAAMQHASQQQLNSSEEATRLHAEVAALKVLKQADFGLAIPTRSNTANYGTIMLVADLQAKIMSGEEPRHSRGSTAGDHSLDSCCESMAKHSSHDTVTEHVCKKQKPSCKSQ